MYRRQILARYRLYSRRIRRFILHNVLHADDPPHRLALGAAIGMFVTFTPTIGFQMVIVVFLSWLMGANKVVGLPIVWLSNPATFVPLYYSCYVIGRSVLGWTPIGDAWWSELAAPTRRLVAHGSLLLVTSDGDRNSAVAGVRYDRAAFGLSHLLCRAPCHRGISRQACPFLEQKTVMTDVTQIADWIQAGETTVAFTGAGISTESGIPDFRSPGGVWATSQPVYFDEFLASPEARYEYWRQKAIAHQNFKGSQPNSGHQVLADWQRRGRLSAIITQNIDGLHQTGRQPGRAGVARDGSGDRMPALRRAIRGR